MRVSLVWHSCRSQSSAACRLGLDWLLSVLTTACSASSREKPIPSSCETTSIISEPGG